MAYFERLLPALRNGAKIRRKEWFKNNYIYFNDGVSYNEKGKPVTFCVSFVTCDDWEIYKEEIDWKYIKDHKCLCNFWDYGDTEYTLGYLDKYDVSIDKPLFGKKENLGRVTYYENCRPLKKGELNFYEDKEANDVF